MTCSTVAERLIEYTDRTSGCWIWTRFINPKGYGVCVDNEGKPRLAHRLSWQQHRGEVPDGMQLDHLCRVRSCCNPGHLEVVTPKINTLRGMNNLDIRKMCQANLHDVTSAGSIHVSTNGVRRCIECKRAWAREYQREKRAQARRVREAARG